ncbi:hypothetical protein HK405_014684, partial [Cladochytrium tenue]
SYVRECREIVVASHPSVMARRCPVYVAQKVGATAIVLADGAQAVAAMAFGAESVPKVDKIVRRGTTQMLTCDGLDRLVTALAAAEGLEAHRNAVAIRLRGIRAGAASAKIVFGAAGPIWNNEDADADTLLAVLAEHGVRELDSARVYGESEERIGQRRVVDKGFAVHTKHPGGFGPPGASKQGILDVAATSFQLLKLDQVDIYYLHSPDRNRPVEETLSGIQELYTQGRFKRFGLSNFLPHEVEEVVRVAREKGYVLPTVYQGNYNAVARGQEAELFSVLRKHGIAFYAYSPLAGGFLTKSKAQFVTGAKGEGRFVEGGGFLTDLYREMYVKPKLLDALDTWAAISNDAG